MAKPKTDYTIVLGVNRKDCIRFAQLKNVDLTKCHFIQKCEAIDHFEEEFRIVYVTRDATKIWDDKPRMMVRKYDSTVIVEEDPWYNEPGIAATRPERSWFD